MIRRRISANDAAWEALYRSLYPRLRAFFVRRVGDEHADDTVSETMTRAVASIDRFVWTDAGFDGWVFGIARHVAVDHHRRQDRGRRYHHITRMFSGNKTDGTAPVEQELVIGDDQALIRDLFTQLTPAEQEVLELRVIAGLSAEQVGEALGHKPVCFRIGIDDGRQFHCQTLLIFAGKRQIHASCAIGLGDVLFRMDRADMPPIKTPSKYPIQLSFQ